MHTLETERLLLRPWMEEDAETLFELAKDPEVGPMAGWPVHTSVDNSREIIRGVLSEPDTYAVVLKETGKVTGSVGLMMGDKSHLHHVGYETIPEDEAEVGYWIGKPYWGRGLIPEAVKCLIAYGFNELHLKKLWCGYYDGNLKSRRVQDKCGFYYEKTVENVECPLIHEVRTEHLLSLTQERFTEVLHGDELWKKYREINPDAGYSYDVWTFGGYDPDELVELTAKGIKTATASAYPLYELENAPIPKVGSYSVVTNSKQEAVCILRDRKVNVIPFKEVPEEQGYKEGEGDRTLRYWREVHSDIFGKEMKDAGLEFSEETPVVCEEFEVVYPV